MIRPTVDFEHDPNTGAAYLIFRIGAEIDQMVPVDLGLMVQLRSIANSFVEEESQRIMQESLEQHADPT